MTKAIDPYAGYTVRIGDEFPRDVFYTDSTAGTLMRAHFRVSRVPSRQEFVVRPLRGATAADLAEMTAKIASIRQTFRSAELKGVARRLWKREGQYWFFYVYMGTPCDDPLVQLELEMMIDQGITV